MKNFKDCNSYSCRNNYRFTDCCMAFWIGLGLIGVKRKCFLQDLKKADLSGTRSLKVICRKKTGEYLTNIGMLVWDYYADGRYGWHTAIVVTISIAMKLLLGAKYQNTRRR